jgi:hypothetical protein
MRNSPLVGLLLTLLAAQAPPAAAQSAIAADLWRVAAGTLVVPPALATDGSAALWTPAYAIPGEGPGLRVGVEAIQAPADEGVGGAIASVAFHPRGAWTLNAVWGRLDIGDLVRTETSPEALGSIPAYAQVLSIGVARSFAAAGVTVGIAARALDGRLDDHGSTRWTADAGVAYTGRHLRLGATTHFFDPSSASAISGASYSLGAEYRTPVADLWGTPALFAVRYGLGLAHGEDPAHLLTAGVTLAGLLELDAGAAREGTAGTGVWRSRIGAAVTAGRYRVYLGRDGGVNGFDATYRFGLAATIR